MIKGYEMNRGNFVSREEVKTATFRRSYLFEEQETFHSLDTTTNDVSTYEIENIFCICEWKKREWKTGRTKNAARARVHVTWTNMDEVFSKHQKNTKHQKNKGLLRI